MNAIKGCIKLENINFHLRNFYSLIKKIVFFKNWSPILIILCFGFLTSFVFVINLPHSNFLTGDQAQYDEYATHLLTNQGYVSHEFFRGLRPPGYPFFLACVYRLFGHSFLAVRMIQCILNAFTSLFCFLIAKKLINKEVAFLSAIILAFSRGFLEMPSQILTETLFMFFLIIGVFFLCDSRENLWKSIISGLLLGISVLIRPAIMFLPFFLLFWFLANGRWKKIKTYLFFFVFLSCYVITVSPWLYRNFKIYQKIVMTTTGGQTFAGSNNPRAKGGWVIDDLKFFTFTNEIDRNNNLYKQGYDYIKTLDPLQLVQHGALKIMRLFSPLRPFYNIPFGFFLPFFICGVVFFGFNSSSNLKLPFFIILYLIFITLIFYGSPRMRGPFMPYFSIFTATALYNFFKSNQRAIILFCLWLVLNFSISYLII